MRKCQFYVGQQWVIAIISTNHVTGKILTRKTSLYDSKTLSVSFAMKIVPLVWAILVLFLPVTAAGEAELPSELAAAIKRADFTTDRIGLFIQSVEDDKPLVALNPDRFLNPASVIKLVTTAAALDLLGQGYRWSTEVMYTGHIEGNTLNGDLYFRGNGDPYLTPERFWRLLNRISIHGIHRIRGDVLIDNSYFEPGKIDYAAFDQQPYRTYNVGPNAVLVGFQATEFHFDIDDTGTDQAVKITPFPLSPRLQIINRVKLVNGRCNAWQKRLSLETRINAGMLEVTFTGNYARACNKRTLYRRVSEAQDHYQHFFLPLLAFTVKHRHPLGEGRMQICVDPFRGHLVRRRQNAGVAFRSGRGQVQYGIPIITEADQPDSIVLAEQRHEHFGRGNPQFLRVVLGHAAGTVHHKNGVDAGGRGGGLCRCAGRAQ